MDGSDAHPLPLKNMMLWGMGLPFGAAAWLGWLGLGLALRRRLREEGIGLDPIPMGWLLLALWTGGYFLYMGTQWVKSMRYFLPIYPALALTAAWGLLRLRRLPQPAGRWLALAGIGIVVGGTFLWAWAFTGIYRQPVSRVAASRWLYAHVPTAVTLLRADPPGARYPLPLGQNRLLVQEELVLTVPITPAQTISGLEIPHLRALGETPGLLHLTLEDPAGAVRLQLRIPAPSAPRHPDGDPVRAGGPEPLVLPAGDYLLRLRAEGGPLLLASSVIANEHWDDGLPLRVDGKDGFSIYQGLEMAWYDDDTEEKRPRALEWLERADWIVLSSQRLVWSIPRLPLRYPMTVAYYRALFEGRLGFDLVAVFHVKPRLGPLEIDDIGGRIGFDLPPLGFEEPLWGAEEAFSVYDHPPVWIFRKRPDFSLEQARRVLESVDLSQVVWQTPRQYTQARGLLMLDPVVWARQQAASTYRAIFPSESPLNRWPALGVVAWWLFFALLGWGAWPLTAWAFPGLRDRGYALARILGPLLFAFLPWLMASLGIMDFNRTAHGPHPARRPGRRRPPVASSEAGHPGCPAGSPLAVEEAVAVGAFAFWLLIRLGHPDLWHPVMGGEKPMDLSYLLATIRSLRFPPYDPWFAGGYINYYYFGYVIVGAPIKFLGFEVRYAYNAAIPTLAALTALGAFAAGAHLAAAGWPRGAGEAHRRRPARRPVRGGRGQPGGAEAALRPLPGGGGSGYGGGVPLPAGNPHRDARGADRPRGVARPHRVVVLESHPPDPGSRRHAHHRVPLFHVPVCGPARAHDGVPPAAGRSADRGWPGCAGRAGGSRRGSPPSPWAPWSWARCGPPTRGITPPTSSWGWPPSPSTPGPAGISARGPASRDGSSDAPPSSGWGSCSSIPIWRTTPPHTRRLNSGKGTAPRWTSTCCSTASSWGRS
jgi:hypothetical protein